jgi:hypothetical protein
MPSDWSTASLSPWIFPTAPAGADRLTHHPAERSHPACFRTSSTPFQLTAVGRNSGLPITQFSEEITISVAYDEALLFEDESGLRLFYFDETSSIWRTLKSRPDQTNNVLIGYTDHFSDFDIDVQGWQSSALPTTSAFQVSAFTGAATYSYPIWVPPGPGGLQPSLSLSYNSQTVDSASVDTQASWVGMGWSLGTGSIDRNMNGTYNEGDEDDDTFSIVVNGVSSSLLPIIDGTSNWIEYRMADEIFWRIRYFPSAYGGETANTWVVWDKNGNVYRFGENDYRADYPIDTGSGHLCDSETWRWPLTSLENVHGQVLEYTYWKDPLEKDMECVDPDPADIAIYPDTISYPNGKYLIQFWWGADEHNTPNRADYDSDWTSGPSYRFFERYILDEIRVKHVPNGATIRQYIFNYDTDAVYPGWTWPRTNGTGTNALVGIEQIGLDSDFYPEITEYNGLHLVRADNRLRRYCRIRIRRYAVV